MKYSFYIITLVLSFVSYTRAQENIDNVWMFGGQSGVPNPLFEGSFMDFQEGEPIVTSQIMPFWMDYANASICNEEGNLLFYTNGRLVANANHEMMENGDNLNLEFEISSTYAMRLVQGVIILPMPEAPASYYILHLGMIPIFPDGILNVASSPFFYSKVSFNSPFHPLGEVIDKNTMITNDTLDLGKIVATRHANGRDWWIVLSKWETNQFYRFLVSPEGIESKGLQEVGNIAYAGLGQAVFSPDGTKYVHLSLREFGENYLDIYDFDRCSGLLSNHRQFLYTEVTGAAGVAISPSSKYLYLNSTTQITQFDLEADDIWASADTVAIYDGYQEEVINSFGDTFNISTTFFLEQLGPDNKIYINATNSVSSLTVINNPDLAGDACDVVQRGFDLPALNTFSLPNFPNYRLGRLEGSPCDTLDFTDVVEQWEEEEQIVLSPNPASAIFTFSYPDYNIDWDLRTITGQTIASGQTQIGENRVDVSSYPNGVYFLSIGEQQPRTVKLVVQH